MKFSALIFLALIAIVLSIEVTEEEGVVVLTDKNFDNFIKEHQFVLVEFYAPWCGHCKQLAPEYAAAAQQLKKHDTYIPLAKVDATAETELADKFEIEGYPTLKFFIKGTPIEYTGGRYVQEIVSWVLQKTQPSLILVEDFESLNNLKKQHEILFVYFGKDEKSVGYETFKDLSLFYDTIQFGYTFSSETAQFENLQKVPTAVLYRQFDEPRLELEINDQTNQEKIQQFVQNKIIPLVGPFNEQIAEIIFERGKVGFFLITNDQQGELAQQYKEVVKKLKSDDVQFVLCGTKEGLDERLAEFLNLKEKDLPSLWIMLVKDGAFRKHRYLGTTYDANAIQSFFEDFKADKLKPYFVSEDIPETNNEAVKVVVANTFNEIVLDEKKDVLFEMYAPWCQHCQALAPTYEQIAEELQKTNPNVLLAKMNAVANEVESLIDIQSFPTIFFYPAGKKQEPIQYEGDNTKEDLTSFILKHTTFKGNQEGKKDDL